MLHKQLVIFHSCMVRNLPLSDSFSQICSPLMSCRLESIRNYNPASALLNEEKSRIFFSEKAQKFMKVITGLDLEKVYQKRTSDGRSASAPKYEFMTNKELKTAQMKAVRRAYQKLRMPPLVPLNKQEVEILDEDPQMIGFTKSNYVFTDISYNVSDRKRMILVREPSGTLRKALPFERHRMNELYFPRPGRTYEHPNMFKKENIKRLLDQREYRFILDRACLQFEPDDEEYHDTTFATFDAINEKKDFDELRSTRHFGPMVFYLCLTKNIGKLIEENLETSRLADAFAVVQLYCLINKNCKFLSMDINPEDKIEYLRKFIESECPGPEKSLQLLDTYWEAEKNPVTCNVD